MVYFWLSSDNALHIVIVQLYIFVFDTQTFVFLPKTKIVRLCPYLEYTLKIQKWWTIPKNTTFLPIKWWLIPKLYQKTYTKWWQHTKYRIQYNHKYVRITKTLYCPPHTNKIIKLSVLHVHIIKLSTLQNIANTTTFHTYPHYNIKLSTSSHIVFNTTSIFLPDLSDQLVQSQSAAPRPYNSIFFSYLQN